MRNYSAIFMLALVTACGGGNAAPPDAIVIIDAPPPIDNAPPIDQPPPLDLTCMNNPAPTTATANITLSGDANSIELNGITPSVTPMDAATIDTCKGNCVGGANKLDSTTSGAATCPMAGCAFTSASVPTGGTPLNAYLKVTKASHRTTNVFPAEPLKADLAGIPALAFSTSAFQGATLFLQVSQNDNLNGTVAVVVTDCANTPITGATVTVKQNGNDVGTIVDAGSFSAQTAGTFIAFDVPPGDTEIGATVNGMTFRTHTIVTFKAETSASQVKPGFDP